uniref:Leucine-rich repeat-containing N-terminal plant-type domain-containing protein n=1 Tax=Populus trichocarpa TaxID=3694 RepID=A0A3N7FLU1_POPTR
MCCTPSTLLLLSLASILSVCSSDAKNMLPSEVETIFKIMESISSDEKWRISYPNPCNPGSTWLGIECKLGQDNHLHVSRLDFGTHPNPTCKNTAAFPCEIFDLPHLQSVFFSQCFTHTKTTLSASPNRGGAFFDSSLQQLSLRSNPALVGPIPPQISFLKSLEILTLSQNRLSGRIPVEIFSLNSLVHLDLSYNMLTGPVPIQLGNLNNLQGLDLSYNSLTGPIPGTIGRLAEFGKLVKLQELRLSNSCYSGTIPPSFSLLVNLSTLSLQNNRLTGKIPEGFSSLSRIYHLNLSGNLLGGVIPFNASFLKRLGRNLDLSGNPGLCLSPSEAYNNVKSGSGVGVCGTGSLIKKSQAAAHGLSKLFFLFATLVFHVMHH